MDWKRPWSVEDCKRPWSVEDCKRTPRRVHLRKQPTLVSDVFGQLSSGALLRVGVMATVQV
jgi:hypothetical protein